MTPIKTPPTWPGDARAVFLPPWAYGRMTGDRPAVQFCGLTVHRDATLPDHVALVTDGNGKPVKILELDT